ncbi:hypothetical protein APHAL10511_001844 [Amanita phalloides]|nr:hypothetical protein APHAL10511_001844 [Amanita phalloides]
MDVDDELPSFAANPPAQRPIKPLRKPGRHELLSTQSATTTSDKVQIVQSSDVKLVGQNIATTIHSFLTYQPFRPRKLFTHLRSTCATATMSHTWVTTYSSYKACVPCKHGSTSSACQKVEYEPPCSGKPKATANSTTAGVLPSIQLIAQIAAGGRDDPSGDLWRCNMRGNRASGLQPLIVPSRQITSLQPSPGEDSRTSRTLPSLASVVDSKILCRSGDASSSHDRQLVDSTWESFAVKKLDNKNYVVYECRWTDGNNQICGYTAKRSLVKRHIEDKHRQIKRFECDFCGRRFAQKSALNIHRNSHTGAKPHPCFFKCGKSFGDPSKRTRHTNRVHAPIKKPRSVEDENYSHGRVFKYGQVTSPMPSKQPQLGSLAVQAPSKTPQVVHVSPSTCHDLSLFKELLKEYRRLDDAIPMRLNRANAAMRDRERSSDQPLMGHVQDEACAYLWRELVANWKRRTQLIEYCVGAVDQSMNDKRKSIDEGNLDASSRRKVQGEMYADEVKRHQVRNELTVESIIRQRSIDAFRARCRYFTPSASDGEGRGMWESGRQR